MRKITEDWLRSAESDLAIIAKILDQENLGHQVAFHAQQTVEKSFKAVIEEYQLGFVKTHSLTTLCGIIQNEMDFETEDDILILLDQLYIDARYPGELGLLPNGIPSVDQAIKFRNFAEYIFNLTKKLLS